MIVKLGCWAWGRSITNSGVQALSQDAMNDVVFKSVPKQASLILVHSPSYSRLWGTHLISPANKATLKNMVVRFRRRNLHLPLHNHRMDKNVPLILLLTQRVLPHPKPNRNIRLKRPTPKDNLHGLPLLGPHPQSHVHKRLPRRRRNSRRG